MPGGMLSGVADTGCGCPNGPNGPNCGFHSRPFAFCPMVPETPNGHRPGDEYDDLPPTCGSEIPLHKEKSARLSSVFKEQQR